MNFENAMSVLKSGGKIARPDVSGVAYIELVPGDYPYLRGVSTFELGSVALPLQFTANDVLAENWEVALSDTITPISARTELMDTIRQAYATQQDCLSKQDLMNAARWHDYYMQLSALSYMEVTPEREQWPQPPVGEVNS